MLHCYMIILLPKRRRRKKNFSLIMCLQLSVLSVVAPQAQLTTCFLLTAALELIIMQNKMMLGLQLHKTQSTFSQRLFRQSS